MRLGNPDTVVSEAMHLPSVYGLGLKWHAKPNC